MWIGGGGFLLSTRPGYSMVAASLPFSDNQPTWNRSCRRRKESREQEKKRGYGKNWVTGWSPWDTDIPSLIYGKPFSSKTVTKMSS